MYASGGERHSPGRWYAVTGGAHEGTYFVHNYDKQIAAHAGTAGWGVGVHVYGPDEGVYDQDDAQAKVDAHVAARLGACRAGSHEQPTATAASPGLFSSVSEWLP